MRISDAGLLTVGFTSAQPHRNLWGRQRDTESNSKDCSCLL